jgi:hypothetical protein
MILPIPLVQKVPVSILDLRESAPLRINFFSVFRNGTFEGLVIFPLQPTRRVGGNE